MSETLKPCPFCGNEATVSIEDGEYMVMCANYHCPITAETLRYDTEAKAVAKWNARAAGDPETFHDEFYDCESTTGPVGHGTAIRVPQTDSSDASLDTRKNLEADVHLRCDGGMRRKVLGWLDRQADITERECTMKWQHIAEDRDRAEMERDELRRQVSELRELNDSLRSKLERVREVVE